MNDKETHCKNQVIQNSKLQKSFKITNTYISTIYKRQMENFTDC